MRWYIFLLLILGVMVSCRPGGNIEIPEGTRIKSTPDGRMYFTNVRAPFYYKEVQSEARMHVWRLKSYDTSIQKPQLLLAIYDAWEREEAYLIPEANEALGSDGFSIELLYMDGRSEHLAYRSGNPVDASRFVIRLYNAQRNQANVLFRGVPLFAARDLKYFQKVCEDYLHLLQR